MDKAPADAQRVRYLADGTALRAKSLELGGVDRNGFAAHPEAFGATVSNAGLVTVRPVVFLSEHTMALNIRVLASHSPNQSCWRCGYPGCRWIAIGKIHFVSGGPYVQDEHAWIRTDCGVV